MTVLCGPTAVGKGTVVARLRELYPQVFISVSATTRAPRAGEKDGQHYFFVSDTQFDAMVSAGDMLEWAVVHGKNKYGTPRSAVEKKLQAGFPVLLEIDLDGARQVRRNMPESQMIFLAPPSEMDLLTRLEKRGTENLEERTRRLETAKTELAAAGEFDHIVINDTVERATQELARLMGLAT